MNRFIYLAIRAFHSPSFGCLFDNTRIIKPLLFPNLKYRSVPGEKEKVERNEA